jgi:LDH2 family malate/lactate/ureidoglycolate dehydrogenase
MQIIDSPSFTTYIQALFQAAGAPQDHAQQVAASLVSANMAGHDSHGVIRTPQYLANIKESVINPSAKPTMTRQTGVVSMVDGQRSFGQVGARYAMTIALEKAKTYGLP